MFGGVGWGGGGVGGVGGGGSILGGVFVLMLNLKLIKRVNRRHGQGR